MKKIVYAISAIAVLLGFTACTSENEIAEPQVSGKTILKAYTETSTTRTALEDDGKGGYNVVWSLGDQIKIGEKTFTLNAGAGTTSGTFEGDALTDGDYTAFYPAIYDGTNWPTAQTYTVGNITGSPMTATFTYTEGVEPSLSFKNEGGILRLTVKGSANVTSIKVNATGLDPITLDCGTTGVALTSEGTQFHIAMPENTYTGVSIELADTDGKVCTKTFKGASGLKIERSKIATASFTASSFKPTITASSPVGTIGMLDGREGIVVDLGGSVGKVVIATMNVGATSVDYATAANNATCYGVQYDEYDASDPSKMGLTGGWSAPTPSELEALYNLTGGAWSAADYDNHKAAGYAWTIGSGENQNTLFFPAAGYNKGNQMGINCSYRSQIGSVYEYEEEMEIYNLLDIYETTKSLYNEFPGCKNCYSVRPFHAMPTASKTYNVGDKDTFDGHEGIVVDIDGKLVAVATMNVGAESVKGSDCFGTKMTYDDACAAWNGWRLPTVAEFTAFCNPFYPACGDTYGVEDGTGAVMWDIDGVDGIDLYLPLKDYDEDDNPSDKYWTGTPGSDGTYYYFAPAIEPDDEYSPLNPEYIQKVAVAKENEFLVRLFHDLP